MREEHMRHKNTITIIINTFLLIFLLSSCGQSSGAPEPVIGDGYYLDTVCSVSIYRMADADGTVRDASEISEEAQAAIDASFDLCSELESKISRTRKDSDISRLNSAKGEWVDVSDDTRELIQKGMEYSYSSDGGFDITVGGVTE